MEEDYGIAAIFLGFVCMILIILCALVIGNLKDRVEELEKPKPIPEKVHYSQRAAAHACVVLALHEREDLCEQLVKGAGS